jgi:hypothetical protein
MRGLSAVPRSTFALRPLLLAGCALLLLPVCAQADAITEWNANAAQAVVPGNGPPQQFRLMAMVHLAAHDALNSIDRRYATWSVVPPANPNASPEAAVARAVRDVLNATAAGQSATTNSQYAGYLSGLSCPAAHPDCIALGEAAGAAAAAAVLEARELDGSSQPHLPYTAAPGPGVYQPTTANGSVSFGNWGNVTPFAIGNSAQFGAGRTDFMNLSSRKYAADYNEVKAIGSFAVRSLAPNSQESLIARFWSSGGADYNRLARSALQGFPQDLWTRARTFALMNMAVSDGLFVTFHTKFKYAFWRPVTAIHWTDDGNPDTAPDATWAPYITTPPYPDYTCGLPNTISSSTSVLRELLGTDSANFTATAAGITRSFTTFSQAADESADARVYGGIHFRTGCVAAVAMGEKIAHYVVPTQRKRQL